MSDASDIDDPVTPDDELLPGTGLPGAGLKAFPAGKAKPAAAAAARTPRRGLWLLLGLVLVMAGSWGVYRALIAPTLNTVNENLTVLGKRQQAVLGQQDVLIDGLKQQSLNELQWQKTQEDRLDRLQARLARIDHAGRNRWLMAETASLLRQAERAARIDHDTRTVTMALELADSLLADVDDPAALPVRTAIAEDLRRTRSQPVPDRVGIYLRLDELASGLGQWRLADMPQTHRETPSPANAGTGWQQRWQDIVARLQHLVILRPRETRDQPMMPPEQAWFLQANLRLQLQQAQWAALRGEAVVYASSLQHAREWMARHYDANDPAVREARARLETLAGTDVSWPDISLAASLKALSGYQANDMGAAPQQDGTP